MDRLRGCVCQWLNGGQVRLQGRCSCSQTQVLGWAVFAVVTRRNRCTWRGDVVYQVLG